MDVSSDAIRTLFRLTVRVTLFQGEREQDFAGSARADFKIGDALVIDFSGKQEFGWIVPRGAPVAELDKGDPVVEHFESGLLPFAIQQMAEDHNRLTFPFDTKMFQRALGSRGTGKLTGGVGSDPRHTGPCSSKLRKN